MKASKKNPMRNILFTISLMMVNMSTAYAQTETDDSTVINFASEQAESAVRAVLAGEYGKREFADKSVPITVGDVTDIWSLTLYAKDAPNILEDLEFLPNLTNLGLVYIKGSVDLKNLAGLPHLTELGLYSQAETDLIIPEGLDKLKTLRVYTYENEPPPVTLRVEADLTALKHLIIDYALESVYLNAAAMPELESLNIRRRHIPRTRNENGVWYFPHGYNNLKILEIANRFPADASITVQDSGLIENYDSLLAACRDVANFSLYNDPEEMNLPMKDTVDLDLSAFSNLNTLTISCRRLRNLILPEKNEILTKIILENVPNTSINISAPDARLEWLEIHNSKLDEVILHPDIKLVHFDSGQSNIGKLAMSMPGESSHIESRVNDIRVAPKLTITDRSVSYESIGGQFQILESQDMINWRPFHTSPEFNGELRSKYTYRKGIPKDAPQTFYKIVRLNP